VTDYLNDAYNVDDPNFVSVYDELPLWSAMFGLVLLEYVPLRPNMTVLDVGAGTGFPALELAGRLGPSCAVYAIDPWKAALGRAGQKVQIRNVPNVRLVEGDAAAMPFDDERFDLIVSNLGINNFEAPKAILAECRRVAKPGASLVLTTNLRGHMEAFYDAFHATLRQLGKAAGLDALREHVDHRVTLGEASDMLTAAGFRIRRVREQALSMRFLDGSALLRHPFIKIGFLDAWRRVIDPGEEEEEVFARLEENLNRLARKRGELALAIPMGYVEAEKAE
jgi:ubiquinone/menaquinone biosynthesis C-methylase UbiE